MNNGVAPGSRKLGYSEVWGGASPGVPGALALTLLLAGCATVPADESVSERLDPDTATTLTILNRPIELLSESNQTRKIDPFAYIAPFETNRMGTRELFLWVSTPQAEGVLTPPKVLCNGQTLNLQPLSQKSATALNALARGSAGGNFSPGDTPDNPVNVDLAQLSLSRAPYDAPVPWSTQWYFKLPADSLKCLADAEGISLQARAVNGERDEFTANGRKNLASLDTFNTRR